MADFYSILSKLWHKPSTIAPREVAQSGLSAKQLQDLRQMGMSISGLQELVNKEVAVQYDRLSLYQECVSASQHPIISGALYLYASTSTVYNRENNATIWCTSKSEQYKAAIEALFERINIEEVIFDWASAICLRGSTKIPLLDGSTPTIKEMAEFPESYIGRKIWSVNPETKSLEVDTIVNAFKTKSNAEMVRVTLDNGESIDCTPNHLFMLRDGSFSRADKLVSGQSLMPLYLKSHKGYKVAYNPNGGVWESQAKLTLTKEFLTKSYIQDGLTTVQIAKMVNCNSDTVRDYLLKFGIPLKKGGFKLGHKICLKFDSILTKEFLVEKYVTRRFTTYQIGKIVGASANVVGTYLKKHGITIRPSNWKLLQGKVLEPLCKLIYKSSFYKAWREKVFKRDNYTCQECGVAGSKLEAHHKNPFVSIFKEFLQTHSQFSPFDDKHTLVRLAESYKPFWDLDNGETLCKKCHKETESYGNKVHTYLNHKVLSVVPLSEKEDVYDLTIEKNHNFPTEAGVFVHNCMYGDLFLDINAQPGSGILSIDDSKAPVEFYRIEKEGALLGFFHQHYSAQSNKDSTVSLLPPWKLCHLYLSSIMKRRPVFGDNYGYRCVHGDTKIKLIDGTTPTIKEMADNKEKYINKLIYACSKDGNIVPRPIKFVGMTKPNANFVRVTLDSGEYVDCTPDHPFMLRDGSFKHAELLVPGESLMPLYMKEDGSRTKIYNPKTNDWKYRTNLLLSKNILKSYYVDKKLTFIEIGKLFGCTGTMIRRILKRFKIPLRSRSEVSTMNQRKSPTKIVWAQVLTKEFLQEYYENKLLNRQEIAKIVGCAEYTIKRYLLRNGIPLRITKGTGYATKEPLMDYIRDNHIHREFIKGILQRDNYTCQHCGQVGGKLEVNHIRPFNILFEEFLQKYSEYSPLEDKSMLQELSKRFAPFYNGSNLETLCDTCHKAIHEDSVREILKYRKEKGIEKRNHKVVRVEKLDTIADAYDLQVEDSFDKNGGPEHCFALACGIFVHNTSIIGVGGNTMQESSHYGSPIIMPALPVLKRLRLAEDSILMGRATRTPLKYLYKVGIPNDGTNIEAVQEIMKSYSNILKRARSIDTTSGQQNYNDRINNLGMCEDVLAAVWGDVNNLAVEKLGGDVDIKWLTDVDKLEGQVCTALAIPQPLLGGQAGEGAQGLSPNSSLENMDVRFSRNITRIQRSLLQGVTRLCQIHLSYLNMDPDTKMFELHMNTTSSAGENEAKENLKLGIEVTSSLFDALAKVVGEDKLDRRAVFEVANENYLKLPDITYDDLLLPEGKSNVPVAPQAGAGPSAGGEMVASEGAPEGAPEAGAEVPPLNASNKPKRGKPLYETIDSRPREGDLKAFTLADKALWESLYGNVTGTILKETK